MYIPWISPGFPPVFFDPASDHEKCMCPSVSDADLGKASIPTGTLEDFSQGSSNYMRWTGVYTQNGYNIQVVAEYMFATEDLEIKMIYRVTNLGSVAIKNVTFLR